VRAAVLLALEIKAGNALEQLQPDSRVAPDLDLRLDRSEGIEGLIQQVAHDAGLWLITGRAHVADRQIVVHAHVTLDETRHLPVVGGTVVALEHEDVAPSGSAAVALAFALVIGVREGRADGVP
jgi:hypothetical protein